MPPQALTTPGSEYPRDLDPADRPAPERPSTHDLNFAGNLLKPTQVLAVRKPAPLVGSLMEPSPAPTCIPGTLMGPPGLTVVQLAGLGGMGELEVVEVGVLLDWLKTSSSM